jgi:hypothetical protein
VIGFAAKAGPRFRALLCDGTLFSADTTSSLDSCDWSALCFWLFEFDKSNCEASSWYPDIALPSTVLVSLPRLFRAYASPIQFNCCRRCCASSSVSIWAASPLADGNAAIFVSSFFQVWMLGLVVTGAACVVGASSGHAIRRRFLFCCSSNINCIICSPSLTAASAWYLLS